MPRPIKYLIDEFPPQLAEGGLNPLAELTEQEVLGGDAITGNQQQLRLLGQVDFGYDVADYTDVHPLFGTLSCVAQSLLQRAPALAPAGEKVEFAHGQITFGQRCRAIAREVFHSLLQVARRLFADGRSCEQALEVLVPA